MVMGHYLTIQRWHPGFNPQRMNLRKSQFGLGLDYNTLHRIEYGRGDEFMTERTHFARLCIAVDLTKTVVLAFEI